MTDKKSDPLQVDYETTAPRAHRLAEALTQQLKQLVADHQLRLAVPVESRVKSWESIAEKIGRKALALDSVKDLPDLVGNRLILLFARDLVRALPLLEQTFTIVEKEDVSLRLGEGQFGYRSTHLVVRLPEAWATVPSFAGLTDLRAEIQVRTLAQHMWAAASHSLQYKQEASVPPILRRAIYRVSALLETVDLEFERILDARQQYVAAIDVDKSADVLNVDILEQALDAILPAANKGDDEEYSDVLTDLLAFDIRTSAQLKRLWLKHKGAVLAKEKRIVGFNFAHGSKAVTKRSGSRVERGVHFFHAGLIRITMREEFGDRWIAYAEGRWPSGLDAT